MTSLRSLRALAALLATVLAPAPRSWAEASAPPRRLPKEGPVDGASSKDAVPGDVDSALQGKGHFLSPVPLIIDTDMSTDVDDVEALCIAHALQDLKEAKILAVVHNTGFPLGVGAVSVINHFYGRDDVKIGAFKGRFQNPLASGADHWTQSFGGGPYVAKLLERYAASVRDYSQVPSALEVYRSVLAAQPDASVVIVSIGFLGNLAALLDSGPDEHSILSGADLVAQKVKELVVMGGRYPNSLDPFSTPLPCGWSWGGYEWNFGGGCEWGSEMCPETPQWSKKVVDEWPASVPLTFNGFEVGLQVPLARNHTGFTPAKNPCMTAVQLMSESNPDCLPRFGWDHTTVLYAVRGTGGWSSLHSTGYNTVDGKKGSNTWKEGRITNQRYLLMNPGEGEGVADTLHTLLCLPRR